MMDKMQFVSKLFVTALIVGSMGVQSISANDSAEISKAQKQSYAEVADVFLDTAHIGSKNKKPIMLVFAINGCSYCQKLKNDIQAYADLKGKIKDNFTPYYINQSYDQTHQVDFLNQTLKTKDLTLKYGALVTPTLVFVSAEGKVLVTYPGYMPKERFMTMLDYLSSKEIENLDEKTIAKNLQKLFQEKGV